MRAPLAPPIFSARECTCGHIVTATSSTAAMDAMDEHYIAMAHIGLRAATSVASDMRLGRKWTA